MDKCQGCHFYDRQTGGQTDSRGIQWGQCRRSAPHLHPINQKTFMIEGVWPHVRDDDWCGEYRAAAVRRVEARPVEAAGPGALLPIASGSFGRPASVSPLQSLGNATSAGSLMSSGGRGD